MSKFEKLACTLVIDGADRIILTVNFTKVSN